MWVYVMEKDKFLYCCYSIPQMRFLIENGLKYELVALNPNTKCTMWVFVKNKKLDNLLNQWTLGSK